MDYNQPQEQMGMQHEAVDLDENFIQELEAEEVLLQKGDGMFVQKYPLYYVTNAIDLLNERYNYLKYDPNVDIVKDQYEGGFKLWEGTNDLLNFLYNNGEKLNLEGKNVLDLGCGSGLVGIFCLKAYNLASVCFQDYNLEVLKFSTLPNLVKNGLEGQISKCKFLSDDWSKTVEKVAANTNEVVTKLHNQQLEAPPAKFDAIFMSEVLYNSDNYVKLANIIHELLAPNGVCIISSKLYYFGCNGSVDEFKEFVQQNCQHFSVETLQEFNDKKSNKREIFAIGIPGQQ